MWDGPVTNFTIVGLPAHGTLSGAGASRTYLPSTNYFGPDSFTFSVNDAALTSAVATVSITVTPGQRCPHRLQPEPNQQRDTSRWPSPLALTTLTARSLTSPWSPCLNGTLSGTLPNLVYQPLTTYVAPTALLSRSMTVADSCRGHNFDHKQGGQRHPDCLCPVRHHSGRTRLPAITLTSIDLTGPSPPTIVTLPAHGT